MGAVVNIRDGIRNLVANLGTSRDKAASSEYHVVELSAEQVRTAYRSSWLAKKIVNIPADDATRKWRAWNAQKDHITKLEAEEKRLGLQIKVRAVIRSARLFGGSAILIGTGEEDLEQPIQPDSIKRGGLKYLTVLDKRDLVPGPIDYSIASDDFGLPEMYTLSTNGGTSHKIHPSRLVIFLGAERPDSGSARHDPWADSVLQATLDALHQADGTSANIASLIFEAKVDTIGIPDLTKMLSKASNEAAVLERLKLAETAKSINGTLLHDAAETVGQKNPSFNQLPNLMDRFFQNVSGAADIPVTRLFGMSPGGLNSTGDGDLKNYYDHIQSVQELDISPNMGVLDEILIRSALGDRPEEVHFTWRPLWQMSEKERAEVGSKTAQTFKTIHEMDVLPMEALGKSVVNALTEAGVAPGLESEVEKHFSEEPGDDDDLASIGDAEPRTLYVHRPVVNADEIIAWAKDQGFESTLPADDLHVTIAFSRREIDWMKVGQPWESELEIPAGGPRMMEQFGEARVLLFAASRLSWRHEEIKQAGATWDHPEYQPHITISYAENAPDLNDVEPYKGRIVLGPEVFSEVKDDWMEGLSEA
ncbi:phage portal protein [uncultured Ruegeria sp.]|uniref:phage portal protein n=1 Tax=uncultured Ruegeria sp. TaxID=259304 RepID=UPI002601BFEF|nr:anti-CBASS Acb1 family protein [uncultured Ruegeria sp.]